MKDVDLRVLYAMNFYKSQPRAT